MDWWYSIPFCFVLFLAVPLSCCCYGFLSLFKSKCWFPLKFSELEQVKLFSVRAKDYWADRMKKPYCRASEQSAAEGDAPLTTGRHHYFFIIYKSQNLNESLTAYKVHDDRRHRKCWWKQTFLYKRPLKRYSKQPKTVNQSFCWVSTCREKESVKANPRVLTRF